MRIRTTVLLTALAAGLAVPAHAQIAVETAWRFNGQGFDGITRDAGPAQVYIADDLRYAGPNPTTTSLGLPIEGLTQAQHRFDTCSTLGLPFLGGVDRVVYRTAGTRRADDNTPSDALCHVLWPATGASSADDVYSFTFGADVLIPADAVPGQQFAFLNDGYGNYNSADAWFAVEPDGQISYRYRGARVLTGKFPGEWFRFIAASRCCAPSFSIVYIDGVDVGATGADWMYNRVSPDAPRWSSGDPVEADLWDNIWLARPNAFAEPVHGYPGSLITGATLFGDSTGQGEPYYIANLYYAQGTLCADAAAALGGPSASGFPTGIDAAFCAYPPTVRPALSSTSVDPSGSVLLSATVTPGTLPPSSSITVAADLTAIAGGSAAPLLDNGTNGDVQAGDGIYSRLLTIPGNQVPGPVSILVTATDDLARSSSEPVSIIINDLGSGTYASQWDFDGGTLDATFGPGILNFWDRAFPGNTESITAFGATTDFGIPGPGGQPARVMKTARYFGDEGFTVDHGAPGNNGGSFVNAYTLVFDVYVPSDGDRSDWFPFHNTNCTNSNDADSYLRFDTNRAGIGALGYSPVDSVALDTWMRVAFVYDARQNPAESRHAIYRDGTRIHLRQPYDNFEGRFALYSTTDGDPACGTFHLFTEPSGSFTAQAYLSSIYFVDRALSDDEVAALAGPDADGIYPPGPTCPADFNGDGFLDFFDLDAFLACFEGEPCPDGRSSDYNHDGFTDFFDLDAYLADFEQGC